MSTAPSRERVNGFDLIGKSIHIGDDVDIGDIEAINRDFIVVKRGLVNIHYCYIPINKVEGWDGRVLWLKINKDDIKTKYERSEVLPDPTRYYIKEFSSDYQSKTGYYTSPSFPELPTISPRNMNPSFPAMHPEASKMPSLYK
jgi:hypothetical protein